MEYLTLQPLVVQHIRERTTRETSVETELFEETTPDSSETGDAKSEEGDAGPSETTTVREYIQSQSGVESDAADSQKPPQSDRRGDDRGPDLSEAVVNRPGTDTDSGPSPRRESQATQSGPEDVGPAAWGDSDSQRGADSPDRSESPPGTPPDTATPAGEDSDARDRGVSVSSPGTDSGIGLGDSTRGPLSADDSVETGPELVVADQSLPGTVSTGRADDPSGPALTVPTNQGTQRAETTAQDHPSRPSETSSGGQTASDQRSQSAVHSSQSHQSAGDEAHESVPLSLDRLEKPTLDRFVEQISDELARHDRIERERRGL